MMTVEGSGDLTPHVEELILHQPLLSQPGEFQWSEREALHSALA